jgi:type 1 fimbriae regulatory protein FimB
LTAVARSLGSFLRNNPPPYWNVTLPPTKMNTSNRQRNDRSREHLTPEEVDKLLKAAKDKSLSRHPEREYCLLLLMVRHGLRASEACGLKLSDIHLAEKNMYVYRLKKGISTTHPLYTGEIQAIKSWLAKRQEMTTDRSGPLFLSEQCRPLSRSMVHRLVQRYAEAAGLADLNIHPHMLRHACGYDLANRGIDTRGIQGFLGHSNIQHTVRYTALSPNRFANYY